MTANIYDMADTWNEGSTTFSAIKMDVTDTASNAGSLLMDLQQNSTSRYRVRKTGGISLTMPTGSGNLPAFEINSLPIIEYSPAQVGFNVNLIGITLASFWRNTEPKVRLHEQVSIGTGGDNILARDAADILAMRRGTNAQTQRWYENYTDASNYSRAFLSATSTAVVLGSEAAGTGTKRNVVLDGANRAAYSETAADIAAALVTHGIMAPA